LIYESLGPKALLSGNTDLKPSTLGPEAVASFESLVPSYHSSVVKVRPLTRRRSVPQTRPAVKPPHSRDHCPLLTGLGHPPLLCNVLSPFQERQGAILARPTLLVKSRCLDGHTLNPCLGYTSGDSTKRLPRCQISHPSMSREVVCPAALSPLATKPFGTKQPADLDIYLLVGSDQVELYWIKVLYRTL